MLTVKAISENGGEDIYHCNRVRYCKNAVILDSYAAETATGNSYSQILWFIEDAEGSDVPNGPNGPDHVYVYEEVYEHVYVSCGGKTIGHYSLKAVAKEAA